MDEKSVLSFNVLNPSNFQNINTNITDKPQLYYDKTSKKIIEFHKDGIRVFNRKSSNLKRDINLKLPRDTIVLSTVDKEVEYMLILIDNKKSRKILVIDLTQVKVLFIFLEDIFEFLLGFFFISNINYLLSHSKSSNNIYFTLVFVDKIIYYNIDKKTQKIIEDQTVYPSNKCYIKDYTYNHNFKILLCVLSNNTFDFFNLSKSKFYSIAFNKRFPFIEVKNTNSGFFSNLFNSNKKVLEKRQLKDIYFTRDKYTQSQFFLEYLYNSLYFIALSYKDNKMHILKVDSLNEIEEIKSLEYSKHFNFSSLQFIDSLIIIHNFKKNSFAVVDIKSKDLIISLYLNVNFPYQNNVYINGPIFEERNNQMMVVSLYNVLFNPDVYVENIWKRYEKIKKRKKLYDALRNLLHRKNSKEIFFKLMRKLIISHPKIKAIASFYDELIQQIYNCSPNMIEEINKDKEKVELGIEPEAHELIKATQSFFINKLLILKQSDIYDLLFKKYEEENLTEQQNLRVILNMILFVHQLKIRNIKVHKEFHIILIGFIRKIKNVNYLFDLLNYNMLYINDDLVDYFVSMMKGKEEFKAFEQRMLDANSKLGRYAEIVEFLFDKGKIYEGLEYFKSVYYKCSKQQIDDIITVFKKYKNKKEIKNIFKYL